MRVLRNPPIVLTIAGSDPSGGAGLQADLKTFHRFGVFGTSVVTLITAQNTRGVTRVDLLDGESVSAQLQAVFSDVPPSAVKTGAIGSATVIERVASHLEHHLNGAQLVVDPVMISKHGHHLLPADAVQALVKRLLPLATVVTPNWHEAAALSGKPVTDMSSAREAARILLKSGVRAVLITGGAGDNPLAADLLMTAERVEELPALRLASRSTHGTGCTFAAAVTAHLALGFDVTESSRRAKSYVHHAIDTAPAIGSGIGPVNHWA
ncbi:MAG TPA: bifunctional hydroxymethylpyrimidine kinase/phosphomethylpyrimidine kinase [Planctomycetota bacterium]|jgi:hydroxymethylpyrimidine/phosphomethylpyrimidine kinase|nr:bifunctional hydroxymethylpyrimidine kinase/phosphomethylpyrimidine kinase [Planctomycetota bacterium]